MDVERGRPALWRIELLQRESPIRSWQHHGLYLAPRPATSRQAGGLISAIVMGEDRCGIAPEGSWGERCPSLADYVRGPAPTPRANRRRSVLMLPTLLLLNV